MDMSGMADKAKDWAGKNPDKADDYVDKGTDAVGSRLGHEEQADQAGEKAKDYLHDGQEAPPPPSGEEPPRP